MEFWCVDAAADGDADGEWDGDGASGAEAVACGVVDDLVVGGAEEAFELDFGDGPHAGHGEADGGADDAGFGEGRVDDAVFAEALGEAFGDAEDAAVDADIFAEDDDAVVGFHFLGECEVDGLDEGEVGHGLWVRG